MYSQAVTSWRVHKKACTCGIIVLQNERAPKRCCLFCFSWSSAHCLKMFSLRYALVVTMLFLHLPEQQCQGSGKPCRPRTQLSKSAKKTILTDVDFSTAIELCLGMNEKLFKDLREMMNAFAGEVANKTQKMKKKFRKINHAQNETSRFSIVQYITASQRNKSLCIGPEPRLDAYKTYNLVKSVDLESLYMVTGKNNQMDKVTVERLILNSSPGELVTVMLGTSKTWRVSGQSQIDVHIVDSREMRLTSRSLNVTLTRQVTKWDVTYVLDVALGSTYQYGGILGDVLASDVDVNFLDSVPMDNTDDQTCHSLTDDQQLLAQYMSQPMEHNLYLQEVIREITANAPSDMFMTKNSFTHN